MNPKIYVILLNYNGWQDTIECLESILKSNYTHYRIVVVDNNSSDNSMHYLQQWAQGTQEVLCNTPALHHLSNPPIKKPVPYVVYSREAIESGKLSGHTNDNAIVFIQSGFNGGFAFGNNVGIQYALTQNDCQAVMLLNNDTVIAKDAIGNIVDAMKQYGDDAIYGGRILQYKDPDKIWYDGGHLNEWIGKATHRNENKTMVPSNDIIKVNFITFCYVLIPKKIVQAIGLIDESYFMYAEDVDYCYRVWKAGYGLYHVANSLVWHKAGASYGGGTSPFSSYYHYRNSLLFRLKRIKNIPKYTAVCYNFLRLPILAVKLLIINPEICRVLFKGTWDAVKIFYANGKGNQTQR